MSRIVYTDLDGTMVGPRGSFWHTVDRDLTATPAGALLELHRAGVPLVLVSGRTFEQVVEAARIFAADGAIAELGALVSWDAGREMRVLPGDLPERFTGRAPVSVMAELLAAVPNATVTDAPMGAGWAQAVRASL